MTLLDFVRKHINQYVTAPGGVGGQCVDLANMYLIEVHRQAAVRLNAVDWQYHALPGWVWVENGPVNIPPSGAIVVWNPYAPLDIGPYGHIAVNLTADTMELVSFDQNWPAGSPCRLTLHDYRGVAGWHMPA